jgi:beta-glucanase (GH16 family)
MKKIAIIFITCSLIFCSFPVFAQQKRWKLAWSDEFNYTGLPNPIKWSYDTGGHGWGNHELEYYTANRLENARVEHGRLIIEARKEDWKGKNYTSARLLTRGKEDLQYGKIEVRARIPSGRGTWPAIWMLGSTTPLHWPDDGEIDIMEHVGFHPGYIHASIHCKKYNHRLGTQKTDTVYARDFDKKFHVYSLDWDAENIRIAIDGKEYFHFKNEHTGYDAWPYDNKMFLLLNLAVGGDWGGQKGVDETIWPRRMEVDWVRWYQ